MEVQCVISVLCLQMKIEAQRKAEEEKRRQEMVRWNFGLSEFILTVELN